jgi:hypothetical protein
MTRSCTRPPYGPVEGNGRPPFVNPMGVRSMTTGFCDQIQANRHQDEPQAPRSDPAEIRALGTPRRGSSSKCGPSSSPVIVDHADWPPADRAHTELARRRAGGGPSNRSANVLRFCTVAARRNSSRAPERPRSRMHSTPCKSSSGQGASRRVCAGRATGGRHLSGEASPCKNGARAMSTPHFGGLQRLRLV